MLSGKFIWVRVRETGPESQLSEISTDGFGACPPLHLQRLQWLFSFCVVFNSRTLLLFCPCFSSDILYWHCVIVLALSIFTGTSRLYKKPLCCGLNPTWILPLNPTPGWKHFLLLPFASPYPPRNPLHYKIQWLFRASSEPASAVCSFQTQVGP